VIGPSISTEGMIVAKVLMSSSLTVYISVGGNNYAQRNMCGLTRILSECDDTSTGTATRAAHYGSLLEGLGLSSS
jgi:hypothetical protein